MARKFVYGVCAHDAETFYAGEKDPLSGRVDKLCESVAEQAVQMIADSLNYRYAVRNRVVLNSERIDRGDA